MTDKTSLKKILLLKRKELRHNLTPEEAVLWTQLKEKQLNSNGGSNIP